MTRVEMLLIKLWEECDEVGQRCAKALRFGLMEVQKEQPYNNAVRIMHEYFDLLAVVELLQEEGHLPFVGIDMDARKARIEKYLDYSRDLGILVDRVCH